MAKRELCSVTVLSFLCMCTYVVFGNALAGTGQTPENVVTSCAAVKPLFEMKNISVDIPDKPINGMALNVCTAERTCCSAQMEQELLRLVRKDFEALLHHNSRSLQGLLVSAADTIREHVSELLRQSESRTLSLLAVVLPRSPSAAREPVSRLYARLAAQLEQPLLPPGAAAAGQDEPEDLEDAVGDAFWRLFPLVYRQTLSGRKAQRDLSADYAACLSASAPELEPFGGAPRRLARALRGALGAARLLRQALLLGAAVLADADRLLTANPGGAESWSRCQSALLRMSYCSRCSGLSAQAKPCSGLCLNVVRGCLTQHAAELDLPWNGYVEAAERLAAAVQGHAALEDALRSIDAHVAEAIIIAMETRPGLDRKVKLSCGPYRWAAVPEEPQVGGGGGGSAEEAAAGSGGGGGGDAPQREQGAAHAPATDTLSSRLQPFLASLSKSRGFYANLAESLCSDESFAETRDTADCWNGQRIGEYTKTVVASSITAQKYNPEITWTPHQPDMRIAELSDQLRHIKQVVVSQVAEAPSALALTRYEGGSGSGQQPGDSWDDEADSAEAWPDEGSGSGDAPIVPEGGDRSATENVQVSPGVGADKPPAESSAGRRAPMSWSLLLIAYGAIVTVLCHRDG
ncbi:division abnormally delayed protein-like [Schistocerca piceifrons]|uniref:division abnormally delayed protein-like n=1 Tax=Schistocerca piceifrons TaxID=274613 RepID=UPI001F5FD9C9|nr:division abnormally delayed protein-like [Schistocerca piceifrons]